MIKIHPMHAKAFCVNRRDFIRSGATAGIIAAAPAAVHAAAPAIVDPRLILYDERSSEAMALAQCWAADGPAKLLGFKGDITPVWFAELSSDWRRKYPLIGGITRCTSLFCLERLAWNVGLRVTWKHELRVAGQTAPPLWQWYIAAPGAAPVTGDFA